MGMSTEPILLSDGSVKSHHRSRSFVDKMILLPLRSFNELIYFQIDLYNERKLFQYGSFIFNFVNCCLEEDLDNKSPIIVFAG